MSKRSFFALSAGALLSAACSAAPDETSLEARPASDRQVERADETLLAEVDVGYGLIQFSEVVSPDGSRTISLSEQAPANATRTPIDDLFSKYGALTALETFRAILPDVEPPAVLVEMHREEAMELGRPSDSFVDAVFDPTLRLEKSESSCRIWVYENPGTPGDWVDRRVTLFETTFGSKWLSHSEFMTTSNVTMGVCNESSASVLAHRCWGTNPNNALDLTCQANVSTNGGWMTRWWNYYIQSSSGARLSARHLIEAESPDFNARLFYLATAYRFVCTSSSQCAAGQICAGGICQWNIH